MAWISVKFYFSVALNVCRTFAEVFFNLLKKKDVFINMGPFGSKYIESLLLPQTTFEYFRTFSEFSSQLSTHKDSVGFLKFWVYNFSGFFFLFVFVNMGPSGSKNFKTLLLPQITLESFQTYSEFSSQLSPQKYCFGFFEFLIFNDFFNSPL